jgi:hypothetical protein
MAMNLGPDPSFMQRMMGATNAMGQQMGGPFGQSSRLTAGMNQNRISRQPLPGRQTTPNSGMMPSGNPNPMGMGGRMGAPRMFMSGGMPLDDIQTSRPMGQSPTMPFVQGPSNMPDFQLGRDTGGNTGINGGMGGFPRPQIQTGNVMNDNQMGGGGGMWNRYQSMQRPQMYL